MLGFRPVRTAFPVPFAGAQSSFLIGNRAPEKFVTMTRQSSMATLLNGGTTQAMAVALLASFNGGLMEHPSGTVQKCHHEQYNATAKALAGMIGSAAR